MIDKILNNYYTKKLIEETKWCFIVRGLDYKFVNEGNRVIVEVNQKKHDKKYYEAIARIEKDEAFKYLCNLEKYKEILAKIINDYTDKRS